MKILLVNAKPTLADALAAHDGVETTLVWPRRHHFIHVPPPVRVRPRLYQGGRKLNVRAVWQLRSLLEEVRPDIVHAFYGRAQAHAVLAAMTHHPRPKIVTFRGVSSPLSRLDAGDWLSYRHPLIDAHACESAAVRDALVASGIDAARCWVTYNSMYMPPQSRPGRAGWDQFRIPEGAFVIGTMAAMRRVKGIDILLRAAIQCADLKDAYWILFGHVVDPEIWALATDPRICDRIRFAGHRQDASELISGVDVFVMPSRAEALCQALLEAMHQGVCPVVSDAGGMREVVRSGLDGLVVPVENVAALALAIRKLHGDRRELTRLAASAQRRIADEFTPEKMAERCLAIYRSVICEDAARTAA
jgi:glycosyltransferase involved in cell wall biosynthesis